MRRAIAICISMIILFTFFAGCSQSAQNTSESMEPASSGSPTPTDLAAIEVKEFQGQDLSSILDNQKTSIKGAQYVDIDTYTLKIDGLVENPKEYTYDQVLEHTPYQKVVTLNCVTGWSATLLWEGILLKDLFDEAKVKSDANTVIFYAYDGYTTSLPLAAILDKNIIMAYKINGVVLPPELGFPFQLVAEDKLGYKWAKWITRIELSSDSKYEGYWEHRGYNNEADVEN